MRGSWSQQEGNLSAQEARASLQEGDKLMVDTSKHLTTLSTGSIVLLTTFLKDIFAAELQDLQWGALFGAAIAAFLLSLLASALVAWLVPLRLITAAHRGLSETALYRGQDFEFAVSVSRFWWYRISLSLFFAGVACFVVFAFKNLY